MPFGAYSEIAGEVLVAFWSAAIRLFAVVFPLLTYRCVAQGFGNSPYLRNRLAGLGTVNLLFPAASPHLAVSEGALRLYLIAALKHGRLRKAIGVETAVDWSKSWMPGMQNREVTLASDGQRLVRGKFTAIAQEGEIIDQSKCWLKPFHLKYRLAAKDPSFAATLFAREPLPATAVPHDWMSDEHREWRCLLLLYLARD